MKHISEDEVVHATDVLRTVSRRDDLRTRIAKACSLRLEGRDVAVLVAIGLLGALPTSPGEVIPEKLRRYVGGGALVRSQLVGQIQAGNASLPISSLLDLVRAEGGDTGWLAAMLGNAEITTLLPDLEDGFETLETKALTDWWCNERGWRDGEQVFHEAKALAYGVNAVLGAFVNPDPLAFGLASWHWYRSLRASRATTDDLVEIVELAVADGQATIGASHDEIARTDRTRVTQLASRPFVDADSVDFLDGMPRGGQS